MTDIVPKGWSEFPRLCAAAGHPFGPAVDGRSAAGARVGRWKQLAGSPDRGVSE